MDGSVVSLSFNRDEIKHIRRLMELEGDTKLSALMRRRLGLPGEFYTPSRITFVDEFEEIDSINRTAKAVLFLAKEVEVTRRRIARNANAMDRMARALERMQIDVMSMTNQLMRKASRVDPNATPNLPTPVQEFLRASGE